MVRLTFLLCAFNVCVFAQTVATPTVIAQEFPGVSKVYVLVETRTPQMGRKGDRSLYIDRDGSMIFTLCNHYVNRDIRFMQVDSYLDTLKLGILPAGKYHLTINYSCVESDQSCDPDHLTLTYNISVGNR